MEAVLGGAFLEDIKRGEADGALRRIGVEAPLWLRYLDWDSRFFNCPVYKLEFAEWDKNVANPAAALAETISELRASLAAEHGRYYLFAEVPSEDVVFLQSLGFAGARLIETRLTYYYDNLSEFQGTLSSVRRAAESDILNLKKVAMEARNDFDRYHADPFFSPGTADAYLGEYVEQCVRGFADVVLIPAADGLPPDAFICGTTDIPAPHGVRVGKLVLVAVAESRRGWYRRLNASLLAWMKTMGMAYVINTTQSTNGAVIHVCEQLGYRLGRVTHLMATFKE